MTSVSDNFLVESSRPAFENYKKGALSSQPQVIKFTSCFPMIGESFWVIQASLTTKTGHHDIAATLLKVFSDNFLVESGQFFLK
jgi:hypothetical protein